jgi:lipoate-protein ligase A
LILGAGQRHLVLPNSAPGLQVVRRGAGGAAVYAGPGVLGQDVFLPAGHRLNSADVVETYRWLGEVWLEALAGLGIQCDLVTIEQARSQPPSDPEVAMACFGRLSPYEVTAGGRKLVGLAQVRKAHGTLLQAGIHLHFDAAALAAALPSSDRNRLAEQLRLVATGVNDLLPLPPSLEVIIGAVNSALVRQSGADLVPGTWSEDERDLVARGPTRR